MITTPMVITKHKGSERAMDLSSLLHQKRTVFICSEVNEALASVIVSQLLVLANESPTQDINMYICSPGGSVVHGLAIYETMLSIKPKVNTHCLGMCASMGAFLLSGGTGVRTAMPHSRIMIHQPSGGTGRAQASDIAIAAHEILNTKYKLNVEITKHTGRTYEEIYSATDRDNFMSAEKALEYGLICKISEPVHGPRHEPRYPATIADVNHPLGDHNFILEK